MTGSAIGKKQISLVDFGSPIYSSPLVFFFSMFYVLPLARLPWRELRRWNSDAGRARGLRRGNRDRTGGVR